MKKLLLTLFISASMAQLCFSQVKLRLQEGISLTNITRTEVYDGQIGYRFGIGTEVFINKTWPLQADLFFLNRSCYDEGSRSTGVPPEYRLTNIYHWETRMNALYLELPPYESIPDLILRME